MALIQGEHGCKNSHIFQTLPNPSFSLGHTRFIKSLVHCIIKLVAEIWGVSGFYNAWQNLTHELLKHYRAQMAPGTEPWGPKEAQIRVHEHLLYSFKTKFSISENTAIVNSFLGWRGKLNLASYSNYFRLFFILLVLVVNWETANYRDCQYCSSASFRYRMVVRSETVWDSWRGKKKRKLRIHWCNKGKT